MVAVVFPGIISSVSLMKAVVLFRRGRIADKEVGNQALWDWWLLLGSQGCSGLGPPEALRQLLACLGRVSCRDPSG